MVFVGNCLHGSRPQRTWLMQWHSVAIAGVAVIAVMMACVASDPEIIDGTGGSAAAAGTGAGPTGGGGGGVGGSVPCNTPADCPGEDTTCRQRSCDDHVCGFALAAAGTACTEDSGQKCDGLGNCAECLEDEDCDGTDVCTANECVPPPACNDDVKNGDETDVDCGGQDCPACPDGSECLVEGDCQSSFCVDGYCCDTACTDSCASCDVPSAEGTCSPSPHGSLGVPSCSPYVCDGVLTTCPTSCDDVMDCAGGFICDAADLCVVGGTCADPPYDCDGIGGNGCECTVGTGCCGTSCQYTHNNGQGQNYFDCVVPGTYNVTQATKACEAYAGAGACGGGTCSTGNVICNLNGGGDCACWGYTSVATGHVFNAGKPSCYCPDATDPMWD